MSTPAPPPGPQPPSGPAGPAAPQETAASGQPAPGQAARPAPAGLPPRATGLAGAVMRAGGSTTQVTSRSRLPMRLLVGALAALILVGTATHIGPAFRAGMHDGTRGAWVVTGRTCVRNACTWKGKFVTPGGHVLVTSAQFSGQVPAGTHVGTSVAGLYPGGGLIFPAAGSDLWISLLIAIVLSLLALVWASRPLISNYLRQRAEPGLSRAPLR